jgi:hypothetical protein
MLTNLRAFAWLALALLPVSAALAAPAGQISETTGYVTVTNAQQAPVSAKKGSGVESGQVITTGANGQAVIRFQDGQVIALKSNSIFKVNKYTYDQAYPEKGESFFSLLQGGLRAVTGLIGGQNKAGWRLATPTATMGIRGTDFFVVIDQATYLKVTGGAVSATNTGGQLVVVANEAGVITSASVAGVSVPVSSLPAGLFAEIEAMSLTGALSGAAAGGAGAAGTTMIGGVPAWVVGIGIAAGAGAAAAGGGGGGDSGTPTTTHHSAP